MAFDDSSSATSNGCAPVADRTAAGLVNQLNAGMIVEVIEVIEVRVRSLVARNWPISSTKPGSRERRSNEVS
ncbi:MAG TPA: hypothetical protein VIQ30_02745 [Pseudonocardia sp.]